MTKDHHLTLTIMVKRDIKMVYRIDNLKDFSIIYNPIEESFLISFRENHKMKLVTTKHFNITGVAYAKC